MKVKTAFFAVVAGALALRLAFVIPVRPLPVSDFGWYFARAIEIAHGMGFVRHGYPTALWPPGWPYVLAGVVRLFGPSVLAGEILQTLFNAFTAGIVYLIGRRLFGHARGLAAAAAYAFLPSAIEWCSGLGSEPLYTLLWTWATYIWIRYAPAKIGWFALSGLLLGAAALVRPSALAFWIILLAYVLTTKRERARGRSWLPAIAMTAFCTALVVAPTIVRNYRVFHTLVVISNNGGTSLYEGNNAESGGGYTGLNNPRIAQLIADPRTEVEGDRLASKLAVAYMKSHPWRVFVLALRKVKSLYEGDSDVIRLTLRSRHFREPVSPPPGDRFANAVLAVNTAYYYALMAFALAGIVLCAVRRRGQSRDSRWHLLVWMIVYNTAIFALIMGLDRYRYPTMPYFAAFSGYALVSAAAYYRHRVRGAARSALPRLNQADARNVPRSSPP